jgi:hypothetical protein
MRHARSPYGKIKKEATTSQLKAAERRLKKERESMPLLIDWVTQQQPTAAAKVDRHLQGWADWCQRWRDSCAADWRRGRAELRAMPIADQIEFLEIWNKSWCPADQTYFLEKLRSFKKGKNAAIQ